MKDLSVTIRGVCYCARFERGRGACTLTLFSFIPGKKKQYKPRRRRKAPGAVPDATGTTVSNGNTTVLNCNFESKVRVSGLEQHEGATGTFRAEQL